MKHIHWISDSSTPEEIKAYKKSSSKDSRTQSRKQKFKKMLKVISDILLWISAVGGFVLGLMNLLPPFKK